MHIPLKCKGEVVYLVLDLEKDLSLDLELCPDTDQDLVQTITPNTGLEIDQELESDLDQDPDIAQDTDLDQYLIDSR